MTRQTESDPQSPSIVYQLPYVLLGMCISRQNRRSNRGKEINRRLDNVRELLSTAANLIQIGELIGAEPVAHGLGLGLAYDVPLFTKSMAVIAQQAQTSASPELSLAYQSAARAFHEARLVREDLVVMATEIEAIKVELQKLANLEPLLPSTNRDWPDETAHLDTPACLKLIQSITPTNGPNPEAKARYALGFVALAA